MLKRIVKTVSIAVTIACLVVCLVPVQAFAVDPVSFAAISSAMDAYGMYYGVGTVYDVSNNSGIETSFSGLWDEFSSYQSNNGSNYDYSQFVEDFNSSPSVDAFTHSSGKFAAWHIDSESAEIFDQFWDWLLTGPAEMTRVDNQYFEFQQSQIGNNATPIIVDSVLSGNFSGQPFSSGTTWYNAVSGSNNRVYDLAVNSSGKIYFCHSVSNSDPLMGTTFAISDSTGSYKLFYKRNNTSTWESGSTLNLSSSSSIVVNGVTYYYNYSNWGGLNYYNPYTPGYSNLSANNTSSIEQVISDIYGNTAVHDTVGVKSFVNDGIAYLPNPYSQDYTPQAVTIVTSVPWDEEYPDSDNDNGIPIPYPPSSVPDVIDDIIGAMVDDTYELVEEDEEPLPPPQEVLLPFIPVNIPSFNFNFSGIWHYVREWVSSLASWFTTLFSIWSILPYAMVVPVYATAVVVIVLGVYKRFFM